MYRVSLRKLRIEAFKSIVEPIEFEFPATGLILISGENGVGKSTLLQAISYLLGYCSTPSTELQSWFTEAKLLVVGEFDTPAGRVTISRGRKSFIQVEGDPEPVTGAAAVEKKIADVIFKGLDKNVRKLLTYRPQKKPGQFLSLEDAKKKDFLTSVIPELQKYEAAIEQGDMTVKGLEAQWAIANAKAEQARISLSSLAQPEDEVEEDIFVYEAAVADAVTHLTAATTAAKDAETRLDTAIAEPVDRSVLDGVEKKILLCRKALEQQRIDDIAKAQAITAAQRSYQETLILKERLKGEIAHLAQARCFECHQPWVDSADAWNDKTKALASLELIEKPLFPLVDMGPQKQLEAILAQLEIKVDKERKRLEVLVRDRETDFRLANGEAQLDLRDAHYTVANAKAALREAKARNLKILGLRLFHAEQRKRLEASLAETEAALDTASYRLNVERDVLMAVRTFLSNAFDDVLASISARTNTILGSISNTSHVTLHFKSGYETQKGTVQKKITPFITVRGHDAELSSGVSGGMESSIELTTDLAVAEVVSQRAGLVPGWLVLDECFVGMRMKSKESCMEILQRYAEERLVIVVDHESEFKEMFTRVIELREVDGHTTL